MLHAFDRSALLPKGGRESGFHKSCPLAIPVLTTIGVVVNGQLKNKLCFRLL